MVQWAGIQLTIDAGRFFMDWVPAKETIHVFGVGVVVGAHSGPTRGCSGSGFAQRNPESGSGLLGVRPQPSPAGVGVGVPRPRMAALSGFFWNWRYWVLLAFLIETTLALRVYFDYIRAPFHTGQDQAHVRKLI